MPLALGRALIALAAAITAVVPVLTDWNETHVFNPRWPPHARFHMATSLGMATILSPVALWLLWRRPSSPPRACAGRAWRTRGGAAAAPGRPPDQCAECRGHHAERGPGLVPGPPGAVTIRMVSFETKVALLVRDDLLAWQALTVAAFLATGIAGAAPEALGAPYEDAAGRRYVPLLGQPIMIYAATRAALLRARRLALERGLTPAVYVAAMVTTGHDAANRAAFRAEPAESPDLAGLALRGPRTDVDRATTGLRLHP